MIGSIVNLIGGMYEMMRMGLLSRFRLGGRYWRWRTETAFPGGKSERSMRLLFEYFMWVSRIRHLR